ncbi:MAG: cation:proton antiporter [Candidatus Eremiobacteraeota bacterium]|nr:cation:proton antiporter [Candidatus Eremiobacteraeota bacterium]
MAGVALRALQRQDESIIANVEDADHFWNTTAYIANAVVFIATGLLIDFQRIAHEPVTIAVALAIVFASRALLVVVVLRDNRARATAFLAGMRGALPLALALALPDTIKQRAGIIDAVFATVFVTLVLQGRPLQPVIKRLYSQGPT